MHNRNRHRNSDPLKLAREDAPAFNRAWLKSGESMRLIQRIGFTLISLLSFLAGLYMLQDAVLRFRSGDVVFVFSGLFSAALLFFGYLGLKNVLRFKKKSADG